MAYEKIVIVEDERLIALELESRLERLGYIVCAKAVNTEETLNAVRDCNPDLILMDIRISGASDGIETAKQVQTFGHYPVIYVTAFADEATLNRAKETMPYGYLSKPVQERDLRVTIEMALHKSKIEKELEKTGKELLKNREQLSIITANLPGIVYQFVAMPDGNMNVSFADGKIEEMLGLSRDTETLFTQFAAQIHPDFKKLFMQSVNDAVKNFSPWRFEGKYNKPSGETIWIRGLGTPFKRKPSIIFNGIIFDITEQKHADEIIRKSNRLYRVLSNINHAITRIHEPERLFNESCRIAVEDGNFVMAWIGILNAQTNKVEVAAYYGKTDGYLDTINIDLNDETRNIGPTGTTIKTGKYNYCKDIENDERMAPWREKAVKLGYRSSISLAIKISGNTYGTITMYSSEIDFFNNEEEIKLLEELAANISFALEFMDQDTQRKLAEEALKTNEQFLAESQRMGHLGSWIVNLETGKLTWSDEMYRIYGVSRDGFVLTGDSFINLIHPDDQAAMQTWIGSALSGKNPAALEFRIILPDGTIRFVHGRGNLQFNTEDQPVLLVGTAQDITGRKQMEAEIINAKQRIEMLVTSSAVMLYSCKAFGDFDATFISDNIKVVTGYTNEEFLSKGFWASHIHPGDAPVVFENLAKLFERGYHNHEYRFMFKDGTYHWMYDELKLIRDENGNPLEILGTWTNITDRKKAEDRLKDNEERFRSLYENSTMGLYRTTPDGQILLANPTLVKMLGFVSFEELAKRDLEKVSYIDHAKRIEFQKHFEENDELTGFESEWYRNDGSVVSVSESTKAVRDEAGKIIYYDGTVEDITKRKLAEKKLIESEEKYRILAESSPEMIYLIDPNGCITYVNKVAAEQFRAPAHELVGKHLKEVFPPDLAQKNLTEIQGVIATKTNFQSEVEMVFPTGSIWVDARLTPVFDNNNNVTGVLGLSYDITARKMAEKEIREYAEQYELIKTTELFGYWLVDKTGKLIDVNDRYCRMSGYTREELLKLSIPDIEEIDKPEDVGARIQRIIENGTEQFESKHKTKDGRVFDVEISVAYWSSPLKFICFIRDITNRKRAELSLKESEQKFRTVIESNPSPIFIVQDERFVFVNPSAEVITGYSYEELAGKHFLDVVHPEHREMVRKNAKDRLAGLSVPARYNLKYLTKSGDTGWLDFSPQFMSYNGKPAILATGIDITENLKGQREREELLGVIESSLNEIFIFDAESLHFLYANQGAVRNLGFSIESLNSMTPFDIKPEFSEADFRKLIGPLLNHEQTFLQFNTVHQRANGSLYPVEIYLYLADYREKPAFFAIILDITDRKNAENKILNISERLKLATSAAHVGIWDLDVVNNKLIWDDVMFQLYGITAESFSGAYEAWKAGLHPEDLLRGHEEIQMALRGEKEFDTEFRVVWPDKSVHFIKANAIVQRDASGNPLRMIGTNWDITGQKLAEEKLQKSQAGLEEAQRIAHLGNWEWIAETDSLVWSKELCNILEVDYDKPAPGMEEQDKLYSADSMVRMKSAVKRAMEEGKPYEIELERVREDGSGRWLQARGEPWFDAQGKLIGLRGTALDITEHKLAEDNIRKLNAELESKVEKRTEQLAEINKILHQKVTEHVQAEERIRLVYNASPYSIILVDSKGTIRLANYTTKEYFGYDSTQLIGLNIDKLMPKEEGMEHPAKIGNFFANPEKRQMGAGREMYALKKDGSLFPVEIGLTPIEIDGEMMVLTNIIDITERKQAENIIKQAKLEAEQANLAKSEFLSRMSHELRTPMNSILGFAQLMNMGELNAKHKRGVNHIMTSGKHLLGLINEVLDISKIEAGHISLSLEPIDICRLMEEITDVISPMANENKITLKIIPDSKIFVKADRQRLKQVLLNLVSNAIKYNRKNGLVTINCESKETEGKHDAKAWISISDSGTGIAPNDIKKLFTPFERIGAEKTQTEGTGLGLVVVKKLMDAMEGSIVVESELGKGSTFRVELPLAEDPLEQAQLYNLDMQKTEQSHHSGTLLYIEDNNSNVELVEHILKEHRTSIRLITDKYGKNTVRLASDYKPDLILLDLDLPDIHGSKVLMQLQSNSQTKSIPVVIISADAMAKQIEKLLKAGAKDYLTKPLDVMEFLKVVDKWMKEKS